MSTLTCINTHVVITSSNFTPPHAASLCILKAIKNSKILKRRCLEHDIFTTTASRFSIWTNFQYSESMTSSDFQSYPKIHSSHSHTRCRRSTAEKGLHTVLICDHVGDLHTFLRMKLKGDTNRIRDS